MADDQRLVNRLKEQVARLEKIKISDQFASTELRRAITDLQQEIRNVEQFAPYIWSLPPAKK